MYLIFELACILFVFVAICMFVAFGACAGKKLYSYRTVFFIGFGIFMAIQAVSMSLIALFKLSPGSTVTAEELQIFMSGINFNFCILTSPLIILFAISMTISNISLIRHEGRKLTNLLGIIVSIVMLAGLCFIIVVDLLFHGEDNAFRLYLAACAVYSTIFAYLECLLLGTIICAVMAAKRVPSYNKDYIIVLGCKISKDGMPLPLLKGRCDRAFDFYQKQLEKTGKAPIIIGSGGKGPDEVRSEGEAIVLYLKEKGIPEDRLIAEKKSKTTRENIIFSREIAGEDKNIAFSTTNYHVFRSGMIAKSCGVNLEGMGSKTKWYFWPNAFMREFAGLIFTNIRWHAILIVVFVALSILLTMGVGIV